MKHNNKKYVNPDIENLENENLEDTDDLGGQVKTWEENDKNCKDKSCKSGKCSTCRGK